MRPRVYLARGARGLETGNRGSINTEIIERVGASNVVDGGLDAGGLYNASLEQVDSVEPGYHPDRRSGRGGVHSLRSSWSEIEAVRRGRVFLSPHSLTGGSMHRRRSTGW